MVKRWMWTQLLSRTPIRSSPSWSSFYGHGSRSVRKTLDSCAQENTQQHTGRKKTPLSHCRIMCWWERNARFVICWISGPLDLKVLFDLVVLFNIPHFIRAWVAIFIQYHLEIWFFSKQKYLTFWSQQDNTPGPNLSWLMNSWWFPPKMICNLPKWSPKNTTIWPKTP